MYFKELNVGGGAVTALVVNLTEFTTSSNKPYLNVVLSDGRDEVPVKFWDTTKEKSGLEEGQVYDFILKCNLYNGDKSFNLASFCHSNSKSAVDFIRKAPEDTETIYENILAVTNSMSDKSLAILVETVYKTMKPKLLYWAAAQKHHHNYYGGLLWHTYRMVKSASMDAPLYTGVDADVVVAACALHDIGKLEEFETSSLGKAEYTQKGNLFGHHLLGYELVRKFILKLKNEGVVFEESKVTNLLHCIVAHHGQREWGAIMPPATPEAKFVFYQDLRDSQLTVFEEATAQLEVGEKTQVFHEHVYKL